MRATIWGCRGSLATPGERTVRYGGNTSSVELRPSRAGSSILDAGTGIRPLGLSLREAPERDRPAAHAPAPRPRRGARVLRAAVRPGLHDHDLGPAAGGLVARRADRRLPVAAVLPAPFEELPSKIEFIELGEETWQLDGLAITSARVTHPGTTLGYRLEEAGRTFTYIPDNELGLAPDSGAAARRRRRPALPRRAVHAGRVPRPCRLGPLERRRPLHVPATR